MPNPPMFAMLTFDSPSFHQPSSFSSKEFPRTVRQLPQPLHNHLRFLFSFCIKGLLFKDKKIQFSQR
jgi:hypothetical protein